MTFALTSRNVNTMLREAMPYFQTLGIPQDSRNGSVLRIPGVSVLTFTRPEERVCFCPVRDANPFFHLMEAIWMLGGGEDVKFVSYFNKGMAQYSDDGLTYNAPYGFRLRRTWGDQLLDCRSILLKEPTTRQAVMTIWDREDLDPVKVTKDRACNLMIVYSLSPGGALDMIVYNRSNDAVWGTISGANTVHMSYFHEWMARATGLPLGTYHQVTANLHAYTGLGDQLERLMAPLPACDRYDDASRLPPIFEGPEEVEDFDYQLFHFLYEARLVIDGAAVRMANWSLIHLPWLRYVAIPVFEAWADRKQTGEDDWARTRLLACEAWDWRDACLGWLDRRAARKSEGT